MRSEQADRADPTVAAIKKSDAASIKVYLADGTERNVAISKARNKWSKLLDVLETMVWERIECLNAKGETLHVIESEEGFDEMEEDDELSGGKSKIAKVMLSLLKATMTETRKMFEVQMKANAELVGAMTEGLHALHNAHRMAMQVQLANMAKEEGDTDMSQIIKLVMMQMAGSRAPTQLPNPGVKP